MKNTTYYKILLTGSHINYARMTFPAWFGGKTKNACLYLFFFFFPWFYNFLGKAIFFFFGWLDGGWCNREVVRRWRCFHLSLFLLEGDIAGKPLAQSLAELRIEFRNSPDPVLATSSLQRGKLWIVKHNNSSVRWTQIEK